MLARQIASLSYFVVKHQGRLVKINTHAEVIHGPTQLARFVSPPGKLVAYVCPTTGGERGSESDANCVSEAIHGRLATVVVPIRVQSEQSSKLSRANQTSQQNIVLLHASTAVCVYASRVMRCALWHIARPGVRLSSLLLSSLSPLAAMALCRLFASLRGFLSARYVSPKKNRHISAGIFVAEVTPRNGHARRLCRTGRVVESENDQN
jgi:hypothetical protein